MKRFIGVLTLLGLILLGGNNLYAQNNAATGGNGNSSTNAAEPAEIRILRAALPYFQQQIEINLGGLLQLRRQGLLTITLVSVNGTIHTYQVSTGGIIYIVILDEA